MKKKTPFEILKPATIDKIIFGSVMIFLLSLNNSIFVNQIGYYLALFFIFVRYFKTNENQFPKTGFEAFFLLFFLISLLSANVSEYKSNALENLVKRMLQIPIVYTIMIATTDLEKGKLFVKTYMTAALLTILVYIGFAYERFIHHLYAVDTSGPSPFQYVMTAGGLMMFTSVFFFSFFMDEKKWDKKKIYYLIGLILTFIAIAASYKRVAWIGTFAGIVTILIFKKKWWMIGAIVLVTLGYLLLDPGISKVYSYLYENGKLVKQNEFATDGKAMSIYADSAKLIVADYQKGIKNYEGEKLVTQAKLPRPVISIMMFNQQKYLAFLVDTRFIILNNSNNMEAENILISPGQTENFTIANNYLYVFDKDSGLTVFKSLENPKDTARFTSAKEVKSSFVAPNFMAYYTADCDLIVYSLKNYLPYKIIYSEKIKSSFSTLYGDENSLLVSTDNSLKLFRIQNDSLKYITENKVLGGIKQYCRGENKLFLFDLSKNMYSVSYPFKDDLKLIDRIKLDIIPSSVQIVGNNFYFAYNKQNRIASIFDPYWVTNINRIDQFQTAIRIFKAHPVLGIGDIGVEHSYAKYKAPYEKENFGHLHNNFTQFLVIFGLFGFVIVMLMLVQIFRINLKIALDLKNTYFISAYSLGALSSFVAFLFAGIAEWNFGDHEIITIVWFTLGLNLAFHKIYKNNLKADVVADV